MHRELEYVIEVEAPYIGWMSVAAFLTHDLATQYLRMIKDNPEANVLNLPVRMNHNGFMLSGKDV